MQSISMDPRLLFRGNIYSTIISYLLYFIIVWLVLWYILYRLFGIHLRSITINNGISFNNITISSKSQEITLGQIRLRLWGNSRKLILDGLHIHKHQTKKAKKPQQKKQRRFSLLVYPSNKVGKTIVKFFICYIPNIGIQLKNTSFQQDKFITKIDFMEFSSASRFSKQISTNLKFFMNFSLVGIVIKDINMPSNHLPVLSAASVTCDVKFNINLHHGIINSIRLKLFNDNFKVSVFKLIKIYLKQIEHKFNHPQKSSNKTSSEDMDTRLDKFSKMFVMVYNSIDDISIFIENSNILEIPFITSKSNLGFRDYLSKPCPITSLEICTKSVNFNITKLSQTSAGFHALFDSSTDLPVNFLHSVQAFTLNYADTSDIDGYISKQVVEIGNIPNYSINFKGNILRKLSNNQGFKDCIAELFFTCSNPIIDLDSMILSSIVYNLIIVNKFLKFKKIHAIYKKLINEQFSESEEDSESESSNSDTDTSDSLITKDRLWNYLQDYYPKIDLKLIIEQPRTIIRHSDNSTGTIQLLNFQYNSLMFQIFSVGQTYDIDCQISHPSITYIEKSLNDSINFEILQIKSFNTKVNVKDFKFKVGLEVNSFKIDLSNFIILRGINKILISVMDLIETDTRLGQTSNYLNSMISRYTKVISRTNYHQDSPPSNVLGLLSEWIVEFKLSLMDIDLEFGSRSVLISPKDLDNLDIKDFTENYDLTCLRVVLKYFEWSFNHHQEDNESDISSQISSRTLTTDGLQSHMNLETFEISVSESRVTGSRVSSSVKPDSQSRVSSGGSTSRKYKKLLEIPTIELDTGNCKSNDKLSIKILMNQLKGNLDSYKVFIIIGAIYIMRENILNPISLIKARFTKDTTTSPKQKSNFLNMIMIDFKIKKTDFIFTLHQDYKLKLDAYQTKFTFENKDVKLYNKFGRILTESPTIKSHWTRIICFDDLKFQVNLEHPKDLMVISELIKIIYPHKHVIYKLFDNLSVTLKIVKHLVRVLIHKDVNTLTVHPSESSAKKSPNINFKASRLLFHMEDDPFESQLNMIFQLGKTEQMKRLDHYQVFKDAGEHEDLSEEEFGQKEYDLNEMLSQSWIRKIKCYRKELNDEIVKNKKFLFGNEAKLESKFQEGIQPFGIFAPLLSVIMDRVDLKIRPPQFGLDKLPDFLHDIGQGVPKDTKFTLILPSFINLQLRELRMHLRDYPLPLLHVASNKSGTSVKMSGHLVIGESLVTGIEHLRNLSCNLAPYKNGSNKDVGGNNNVAKYYKLNIEKTMATVKLYTDLQVEFTSPARFVWGQSYQFGIQQLMLNFDQFSKPPIDPSTKLGFWDKLRLVMHGKFKIKCTNEPLEVAFKGSTDPYDIFNEGSGFILSFNHNVIWTINEFDDSRQFCNVKSDTINFYIPNYLAGPLMCWCRESFKTTFLPHSNNFITSCYGYYLNDQDYSSAKDIKIEIYEKKVVSLSGGVDFRVGFVLQRLDEEGNITEECKPHYEVNLFNPDHTEEGHDSYKGFRSDYINMLICMDANYNDSYNTIHLSPAVFLHFFKWWKLFSGNTQLPIRKGILFNQTKKASKFSQHLVSNRFKFNLKSLFLSHVYRDDHLNSTEESEEDFVQCYGLRAKMNNFIVDLHQRKEERISVNQQLSRNEKVKKMNFHIGDVHLDGIDLRVLTAKFDFNVYKQNRKPLDVNDSKNFKFEVFDNDKQWFDIEDYEDAFLPSICNSSREASMHPLLYTESFSYLRDTEPDARFKENDLFFEESNVMEVSRKVFKTRKNVIEHRIKQLKRKPNTPDITRRLEVLTEENKSLIKEEENFTNQDRRMSVSNVGAKFHNKFVLLHMLLKWNNNNRNLLAKYLHYIKAKASLRRYLSFESISVLEQIVERAQKMTEEASQYSSLRAKSHKEPQENQSCQERLDNFEDILSKIQKSENLTQDYMIEIISPQIQLQSEEFDESIIILSTPKINAKILSVYEKNSERYVVDIDELENRYGVLLENTNALVFQKDKVDNNVFDEFCYGSTTNWPPWLGFEVCKEGSLGGKENLIIQNISAMVTYVQQKALGKNISRVEDDDSEPETNMEKLTVDIPKVVISSTSSQYYTLYLIMMDLLIYTEPSNKLYLEKLEKLKFSIDFEDMSSLYERILRLHSYQRLIEFMSRNYNFRQGILSNEDLNDYLAIKSLQSEIISEISLMMNSILTGNTRNTDNSSLPKAEWIINTDEIILHMLEDDRTPIIDIAMAKGKFRRTVNEDDSNINRIEILMMQGFNLLENARFPAFLEPLDGHGRKDNLITVDWSMYKEVGGIKLIDNFEINSQPLSLRMDQKTGKRLMNYIFKTDIDNIEDSPLLDNDSDEENGDNDDNSDDDSDSNSDDEPDEGRVRFDAPDKKLSYKKSFSHTSQSDEDYQQQLEDMVSRSKKYISVNHLKINPVALSVSLKLKGGYKRLLNVTDFKFVLPELMIQRRILSVLELTMVLKKFMIKAILGHAGGLLRNKLTVSKAKKVIGKPLTPLKRYANFTSINELREG